MGEERFIRKMLFEDIEGLSNAFVEQGWPGRRDILYNYFLEQEARERQVLVALVGRFLAGYITVIPSANHGPFAGLYPELTDFNVFESFQRQGIGTALIEKAEQEALKYSDVVTLGVGLHKGYGPAQRLYVKRGYIPDGSGLWFNNEPLAPYAPCENSDDLVLYFSKKGNKKS